MSGELVTGPDGQQHGGGVSLWYPRARATLDVILDGFTSDLGSQDTPLHVTFYPKTAKIHSNSYHMPDAWEMTFDARDCPFDPALIRLAMVQLSIYDAGGVDDPPAGPGDAEPDIIGLFDDDSMELSGDGRWITVQGQDLTTLFSGKQWPPMPGGRARRIPTGKRLDLFVNDLVQEVTQSAEHPNAHAMGVVFGDGVSAVDMPTIGKDQPAGHGRGIPVKQGTTYWDVIYGTVTRHGYICYVRGWNIVIAKPKNLSDYRNADIAQMAWGNNIEYITLQRKLGKQNVPTIIVVAYDENGQHSKRVPFPDPKLSSKIAKDLPSTPHNKLTSTEKHTIKGTTAQKVVHHKGAIQPKATVVKKDEEFMIVPVHGIWDDKALLRAAESLHTLIGRGERRIIVKTHDLQDINGKPLLNLSSGDAAEIFWQDFDFQTMPAMSTEQRVQYLKGRGYQDEVAQTLSLAYDKLHNKLNPPMRIRELTKTFDNQGGLDFEMELVDFATASIDTAVPR